VSAHLSSTTSEKPTVAFAMGDPAGISPELAAKLLAADEFRTGANLVVLGDLRILEQGAKVAGVAVDVAVVSSEDAIPDILDRPVFVDLKNLSPDQVVPATATLEGGVFATENFRRALLLAQSGRADAVFFTPFNKKAMRLAYEGYDDEIRFVRDVLKTSTAASEFNVLGKLWNARVTSHIPLSQVASAISEKSILRSLTLADWQGSTPMPGTGATSAARRSMSSSRRFVRPRRRDLQWKVRFRRTQSSCAPRTATSMPF
jgi:4-hydroxythreonine-4-phosphate dehydrogenase